MNRRTWLCLVTGWAACIGVFLSGCSQDVQVEALHSAPSAQELHLAVGEEVLLLDSSRAYDSTSFRVLGQLNEGLIRLDQQGNPTPGVAKEWQVAPDGLTYVFTLREDARWSDGTTVTAHDFEYAWKRTLDPKTASPYAFMLSWLKGGSDYSLGQAGAEEVGVTAKGDFLLEVTLQRPTPHFLSQLGIPPFFPQKRALVELQGDNYGRDNEAMVSNGPFLLRDWQQGRHMELEKNVHYWDRKSVRLEKVIYQVVRDPNAMENLYASGAIDYMKLNGKQYDRYKDSAELKLLPELTTGYLQFNTRHKHLQNMKLRQALGYAVDAQAYVDLVYSNGTRAATGLVPYGTSNGRGGDFRKDSGDLMRRSVNRPRAGRLLQEAMSELKLTHKPALSLMMDETELSKRGGEFLREQWRVNLGLDVKVEYVQFQEKLRRSRELDYDIVLSLWGADYNDPLTFLELWVSGQTGNQSGYSNPGYDHLIESIRMTADVTARMRALAEAEQLLLQDMPVAPLFFRNSAVLTKSYVKGWRNHPFLPEYDLKSVYIEA